MWDGPGLEQWCTSLMMVMEVEFLNTEQFLEHMNWTAKGRSKLKPLDIIFPKQIPHS